MIITKGFGSKSIITQGFGASSSGIPKATIYELDSRTTAGYVSDDLDSYTSDGWIWTSVISEPLAVIYELDSRTSGGYVHDNLDSATTDGWVWFYEPEPASPVIYNVVRGYYMVRRIYPYRKNIF